MSMTPKELIEAVYEIAYGEDAHLRGFFPEEVVERLQEFSDGSNPILIEEAWNEAEELNTSLRELNDYDLVACRQDLIDRTNRIMEALNEIGTEEQSPLNCTIIRYEFIMKAKISKDRFLDWVYSSTDDTESLVDDVISSLYSQGQFAIDLDSILDNISFIPASLVENLDEIKEDFKDSLDSDIFEYPEDSEIECPMVLQPVEWTTGYGYKEAD